MSGDRFMRKSVQLISELQTMEKCQATFSKTMQTTAEYILSEGYKETIVEEMRLKVHTELDAFLDASLAVRRTMACLKHELST